MVISLYCAPYYRGPFLGPGSDSRPCPKWVHFLSLGRLPWLEEVWKYPGLYLFVDRDRWNFRPVEFIFPMIQWLTFPITCSVSSYSNVNIYLMWLVGMILCLQPTRSCGCPPLDLVGRLNVDDILWETCILDLWLGFSCSFYPVFPLEWRIWVVTRGSCHNLRYLC